MRGLHCYPVLEVRLHLSFALLFESGVVTVKKILWLEPDVEHWEAFQAVADVAGGEVTFARTREEAEKRLRAEPNGFDLVISAIRVVDAHGLDFLRELKHRYEGVRVAVCSACEVEKGALKENGGFLEAWWVKPVLLNHLLDDLRAILRESP